MYEAINKIYDRRREHRYWEYDNIPGSLESGKQKR